MLSRRHALMLFGLGGAASAGLFTYGLTAPFYIGRDVVLQQALLQVLPDRHQAAAIGKAWMKQYRIGFLSPKVLAGRLSRQLQAHGWADQGDVATLRQALAEAVRKDFLHGSVVDVRGWQIARTHADLCALAHLTNAHV
jgi:hypothetical protein